VPPKCERAPAASAAARTQPAWFTDRVRVTPVNADTLAEIATDHGASVLRGVRASGIASVSVPAGIDALTFIDELREDPRVARAGTMGMIRGAGNYDDQSMRASAHQWHLVASRAPLPGEYDLSGLVVAVLDTGVAYEDGTAADGTQHVVASSLSGVTVTAAHDFVNDDADAWDDHQHGTHIASLILSDGDVEGVAPGAQLMPLKVLDADNVGTEQDLADAILHAVDNGADVINLSLSFAPGYVPGLEVRDAIDYAADAGVVMVAAAGNDGLDVVTWPAASPAIVAVAAARPGEHNKPQESSWDNKSTYLADYSNRGGQIDLTVAGGGADHDRTSDGVLDGMVAETINLNDPSTTGLWVYDGTSQAAAVVSGAALQLLASGASPDQVAVALQYEAFIDGYANDSWKEGAGAGGLNLEKVLEAIQDQKPEVAPRGHIAAGVLPYLRTKGSKQKTSVRAEAVISVVDEDGDPITYGTVYASIWTDTETTLHTCNLGSSGTCNVNGQWINENDSAAPTAFAITVDGWHDDTAMVRVGKAMFATDGGEILLSAMADEPALDGAFLAYYFDGTYDPQFGNKVAESYAIVDRGTGLSSSPLGVLFRPEALEAAATITELEVDLDGTGLSSSPLGIMNVQLMTLDGSGLSSSPLGFSAITLAAIDGTGLSSSPLGFHPVQMHQPTSGNGLSSSPLGLTGNPILLGPGEAISIDLTGMAFEGVLLGTGAVSDEGYEIASQIAGSGATDVGMTSSSTSGTSGTGTTLEDATL